MLNSFLLNQAVLNGSPLSGLAVLLPFLATQRQIETLGFAAIVNIHGQVDFPSLLGNVQSTNIEGKAE